MTTIINVIQSDIANGRPRNELFNPIVLALRRSLSDGEVGIALQKKFVVVDGLGKALLPPEAVAFNKRFNDVLAVEPITFSVEIKPIR